MRKSRLVLTSFLVVVGCSSGGAGESPAISGSSGSASGGGGGGSSSSTGAGGAGGDSSATSTASAGGASAGGASSSAGGASSSSGAGGEGGETWAPELVDCGGIPSYTTGPYVPWISDVTAASGLAADDDPAGSSPGNGATAGDIDGDGRMDLVLTQGKGRSTLVYRNMGGLVFQDVTAEVASSPLVSGYFAGLADLDGDGDPDLLVTGEPENGIYENVGGHFEDRTANSGIVSLGRTSGAVLGDFDADGQIDAFLVASDSRMYRAKGGFQYEDVTASWGLSVMAGQGKWTGASLDYDGDGKLDLYVQIHTGLQDLDLGLPPPMNIEGDQLFHNETVAGQTPHFVRKDKTAGLGVARSSMGAVVADFNGDERLDLYVSNFGKNPLFLAQDGGTFVDATAEYDIGATRVVGPSCPVDSTDAFCVLSAWGSVLFDADHDGDDDLLIVNGLPGGGPHNLQPASQFRQEPAGFSPVESALGCSNGRTLLPADLDGDGDLDLVATQVNGPVRLFRNEAPADMGWLRVRLAGKGGNRDGIGALVRATFASGKVVTRAVGAGGLMFGLAPPEAHFVAAGDAMTALDVVWPSGATQHLGGVEGNQVLTVAEP